MSETQLVEGKSDPSVTSSITSTNDNHHHGFTNTVSCNSNTISKVSTNLHQSTPIVPSCNESYNIETKNQNKTIKDLSTISNLEVKYYTETELANSHSEEVVASKQNHEFIKHDLNSESSPTTTHSLLKKVNVPTSRELPIKTTAGIVEPKKVVSTIDRSLISKQPMVNNSSLDMSTCLDSYFNIDVSYSGMENQIDTIKNSMVKNIEEEVDNFPQNTRESYKEEHHASPRISSNIQKTSEIDETSNPVKLNKKNPISTNISESEPDITCSNTKTLKTPSNFSDSFLTELIKNTPELKIERTASVNTEKYYAVVPAKKMQSIIETHTILKDATVSPTMSTKIDSQINTLKDSTSSTKLSNSKSNENLTKCMQFSKRDTDVSTPRSEQKANVIAKHLKNGASESNKSTINAESSNALTTNSHTKTNQRKNKDKKHDYKKTNSYLTFKVKDKTKQNKIICKRYPNMVTNEIAKKKTGIIIRRFPHMSKAESPKKKTAIIIRRFPHMSKTDNTTNNAGIIKSILPTDPAENKMKQTEKSKVSTLSSSYSKLYSSDRDVKSQNFSTPPVRVPIPKIKTVYSKHKLTDKYDTQAASLLAARTKASIFPISNLHNKVAGNPVLSLPNSAVAPNSVTSSTLPPPRLSSAPIQAVKKILPSLSPKPENAYPDIACQLPSLPLKKTKKVKTLKNNESILISSTNQGSATTDSPLTIFPKQKINISKKRTSVSPSSFPTTNPLSKTSDSMLFSSLPKKKLKSSKNSELVLPSSYPISTSNPLSKTTTNLPPFPDLPKKHVVKSKYDMSTASLFIPVTSLLNSVTTPNLLSTTTMTISSLIDLTSNSSVLSTSKNDVLTLPISNSLTLPKPVTCYDATTVVSQLTKSHNGIKSKDEIQLISSSAASQIVSPLLLSNLMSVSKAVPSCTASTIFSPSTNLPNTKSKQSPLNSNYTAIPSSPSPNSVAIPNPVSINKNSISRNTVENSKNPLSNSKKTIQHLSNNTVANPLLSKATIVPIQVNTTAATTSSVKTIPNNNLKISKNPLNNTVSFVPLTKTNTITPTSGTTPTISPLNNLPNSQIVRIIPVIDSNLQPGNAKRLYMLNVNKNGEYSPIYLINKSPTIQTHMQVNSIQSPATNVSNVLLTNPIHQPVSNVQNVINNQPLATAFHFPKTDLTLTSSVMQMQCSVTTPTMMVKPLNQNGLNSTSPKQRKKISEVNDTIITPSRVASNTFTPLRLASHSEKNNQIENLNLLSSVAGLKSLTNVSHENTAFVGKVSKFKIGSLIKTPMTTLAGVKSTDTSKITASFKGRTTLSYQQLIDEYTIKKPIPATMKSQKKSLKNVSQVTTGNQNITPNVSPLFSNDKTKIIKSEEPPLLEHHSSVNAHNSSSYVNTPPQVFSSTFSPTIPETSIPYLAPISTIGIQVSADITKLQKQSLNTFPSTSVSYSKSLQNDLLAKYTTIQTRDSNMNLNEICKEIHKTYRDNNKDPIWKTATLSHKFKFAVRHAGSARADGIKPYQRKLPLLITNSMQGSKENELPIIIDYKSLAKSPEQAEIIRAAWNKSEKVIQSIPNSTTIVTPVNSTATPVTSKPMPLYLEGPVITNYTKLVNVSSPKEGQILKVDTAKQHDKISGENKPSEPGYVNKSNNTQEQVKKSNKETFQKVISNKPIDGIGIIRTDKIYNSKNEEIETIIINDKFDDERNTCNKTTENNSSSNQTKTLEKPAGRTAMNLRSKTNAFQDISRTCLALDRLYKTRKVWISDSFHVHRYVNTLQDLHSCLIFERRKQKLFLEEMLEKLKAKEVAMQRRTSGVNNATPAERLMQKLAINRNITSPASSTSRIHKPPALLSTKKTNQAVPKKKTFKDILEEQRRKKLDREKSKPIEQKIISIKATENTNNVKNHQPVENKMTCDKSTFKNSEEKSTQPSRLEALDPSIVIKNEKIPEKITTIITPVETKAEENIDITLQLSRRRNTQRMNPKDPLLAEERALQQAIALSLRTAEREKKKELRKSEKLRSFSDDKEIKPEKESQRNVSRRNETGEKRKLFTAEELIAQKKKRTEIDILNDSYWNESGIRADTRSPTEVILRGGETREQRKLHYALARIAEMEYKKNDEKLSDDPKKARIETEESSRLSRRISSRHEGHRQDKTSANNAAQRILKRSKRTTISRFSTLAMQKKKIAKKVTDKQTPIKKDDYPSVKMTPISKTSPDGKQHTENSKSLSKSSNSRREVCIQESRKRATSTTVQQKEYILVPSYNGFKDFTPELVESKTRRKSTPNNGNSDNKKNDFPLMVVSTVGDQTKQIIIKKGENKEKKLKQISVLDDNKSLNDISRSRLSVSRHTGETLLHKAARKGYFDVAQESILKGANVNAKDNAGWTPLHEACAYGCKDIVELILRYGGDPNVVSHSGIRPFHDACEKGYIDIVRLLLSYGADHTISTYAGYLPVESAPDIKIRQFLRDYGDSYPDENGITKKQIPWKYEGSCEALDSVDYTGIFDDIPQSDGAWDIVEFDISAKDMLNSYYLSYTNKKDEVLGYRNYILLNDILQRLSCTRNAFLLRHPKLEIREMKWSVFEKQASQSVLNIIPPQPSSGSKTKDPKIELVYLTPHLYRKIFNVKSKKIAPYF